MPSGQPKALVPKDLRGVRKQQIAYLEDPQSFLKLLGNLGSPQSSLQRAGANSYAQQLNSPTPEQQAFNIALPQLQEMLTGTGPQFEHDLASANQTGNRFGSANALMRGEALRNLYNLRTQVAGTLGMLGSGAGGANRALAGQAFDVGKQQAGQADIETQRRLQILLHFLTAGQNVAFNVPTKQGGGGLLGFLGTLLSLGSKVGNLAGGGGSDPNNPYGDGPIQSGSGAGP